MDIDWGFAGQIGGMGFGMVFVLLIILGIVVKLTGFAITKSSNGKDKKE